MTRTSWLRLQVRVPPGADAHDVITELIELGGTAVQEDDGALVTFVAARDDAERFVHGAARRLAAVIGEPPDIAWRRVADRDWLARWRAGLGPRRIGERLVIRPSWTPVDAGRDDIVITIDPAMAFGTGEHASTRGVLRLLEPAVRAGDRVLDVGTGTGILAIAAARLGAGGIIAVEPDADAIEAARENVRRNRVRGIEFVHGAVDARFLEVRAGEFDLILANVLSGVLVPLLAAFHRGLRGGGRLVLGGLLRDEADHVRTAARRAGLVYDAHDAEDEWWAARFRR